MRNLAKLGFPLQVGGIIVALIGVFIPELVMARTGLIVHLVGDALFFLQMRHEGCV